MPLTLEDHAAINAIVAKFGTAYSDTAADDIQTLLDIIERLNGEAEDVNPFLGATESIPSETFLDIVRRAYGK